MYAAWDIDVKPDGHGLPVGKGNAKTGKHIFNMNCAKCHGDKQDGFKGRSKYPILAPYPTLVGDQPSLDSGKEAPAQTVGSYWPYSTTLFDYIRRAMPFWHSQSLSDDEVYALSAYIFFLNGIIGDEDKELNHTNLYKIQMPNRNGFICDPRPDTDNKRCMKNCTVAKPKQVSQNTDKSDCMPAF